MAFFSITPLPSSSSATFSPLIPHRRHFLISSHAFPHNLQFALEAPPEVPPEADATPTGTKKKKKKKLRPSFCEQVMERWSLRISSKRTHFPWQEDVAQKDPWGLGEESSEETQLLSSPAGGQSGAEGRDDHGLLDAWNLVTPEEKGRRDGGVVWKKSSGQESSEETQLQFFPAGVQNGAGGRSPEEKERREGGVVWKKPSGQQSSDMGSGDIVAGANRKDHCSVGTRDGAVMKTQLKERREGGVVWKKPSGQQSSDMGSGDIVAGANRKDHWSSVGTRDGAVMKTQLHSGIKERRTVDNNSQVAVGKTMGGGLWKKPLERHSSNKNLGGTGFVRSDKKDYAHLGSGVQSPGLPRTLVESEDCNDGEIALVADDDEALSSSNQRMPGFVSGGGGVGVASASALLPWQREDPGSGKEQERSKSNTELAERTIPEPELRRLRNESLRMKERMKVGARGVTEALVQRIREKWEENEVVKLRFEGKPSINMKRIHENLESRTGGLVIWRSGASVVLYRGMSYKLPCVQSYTENINRKNETDKFSKQSVGGDAVNFCKRKIRTTSDPVRSLEEQSKKSVSASKIDSLLNELGPRFRDWGGREPLPVDADLLPHVIPGYKPPFRLLPYKAKVGLRDREMTYLRRLARSIPPHFALGRNREHHGLAQAMVKLWEKSLIAKIAIKRGVPNTCNDRMAEELRRLTGGVLLSRNKEFIVFYRGNDFVPPPVSKILVHREKLADARQEEEDQARRMASDLIIFNAKPHQAPSLAGTLAETLEAKNHWANELSSREREKTRSEELLSKHESVIRCMERKLGIARDKVAKAEKALARVQESLVPRELPSDLETVTDEERFLFRNMGLKMRSYLSVGRRGIFDGTIENMHLSWKYRELVKILVKRKTFSLVKHIAISLEAESGGVLISVDKTTKGYVIIVYRGKNYQRPDGIRPKNLLTRRKALARSIELQRREALKYHLFKLQEKIKIMKMELEQMRTRQITDDDKFTEMHSSVFSDDGSDVEEEGEEAYLETYKWDPDEDGSHDDGDDEDDDTDDDDDDDDDDVNGSFSV